MREDQSEGGVEGKREGIGMEGRSGEGKGGRGGREQAHDGIGGEGGGRGLMAWRVCRCPFGS